MYTQRIIHVPALGKNAELRAALEERQSAAKAAAPHALSVSMFALEPTFVHSIRFDNLAAIEAYQEQQQGDAAFQAVARKITQCLARPQAVLLYEDLVRTEVTTTPKFRIVNRYCPAPGQGAELRVVLEERVQKSRPPGLAGAGLSRQVASVDGPAFAVNLLFASMAAMDEFRSANDTDSTFQSYAERVASLSRTPFQQRVLRILVPFPA
jgi:hypothetical protein